MKLLCVHKAFSPHIVVLLGRQFRLSVFIMPETRTLSAIPSFSSVTDPKYPLSTINIASANNHKEDRDHIVYCCVSTRTCWLCFACKIENCLIQTWLVIILFYTQAVYVRKSKRFENPNWSYHLIRAA